MATTRRRINLPLDYIHDISHGYGRILIPLGKGRWLMLTKRWQLRRTWHLGFHNCSATGVY